MVFCAKLVRAPLCWRRLVRGEDGGKPHEQNRNALALCVRCSGTGEHKLFASCFSEKCAEAGRSRWVELTEEHASLLHKRRSKGGEQ